MNKAPTLIASALCGGAEGRKVITKQHDSHMWLGSIAHNIPGVQWLYEVFWRCAATLELHADTNDTLTNTD